MSPFDATAVTWRDTADVARLLRRAFDAEPVQRWLFPGTGLRWVASELWFRALIAEAIPLGTALRLVDGRSAAIWFPPGARGGGTGIAEVLLRGVTSVSSRSARAKAELDRSLSSRRPLHDHWYLAATATESGYRSQGRGAALMEHTLRLCDRTAVPAYLETSTPRSVPFYRSLGFEVCDSFSVLDGPPIWCLGRQPAVR